MNTYGSICDMLFWLYRRIGRLVGETRREYEEFVRNWKL